MGSRAFFHDEAVEFRDTFSGSDRDKRYLDQLIEQDRQRLTSIMSEQYTEAAKRVTGELEAVVRISTEGLDAVEEILEDLRNGEITAREAATRLGAAKRDANSLRKTTKDAPAIEERAWSEVNCEPGRFQRNVAHRFPALFKNGRGLLALPTNDE